MVGRTRLVRTTGSPLIGGWTRRKQLPWAWIVAALVLIAAVAAGVWYFFLR